MRANGSLAPWRSKLTPTHIPQATQFPPNSYVENLVGLFRAVWRVLHPTGTVFLNLGDAYANTGTGGPNTGLAALADQYAPRTIPRNPSSDEQGAVKRGPKKIPTGLKHKDLLMLPARVALALQDDGWWIRSHIAWVKDCGMPESVRTDRRSGGSRSSC
jgi:DNA modification methylase